MLRGDLRLLRRVDEHIFRVELWALWDGDTANGWRFANLEEHLAAWCGIPVLCAYVNGGTTIGDGHNQTQKTDENGAPYQSFTGPTAERIVGATQETPDGIRVVETDGHKWLVCRAHLWAWYAAELVNKIRRLAEQGGKMSVSIEALAKESHMEGEVEIITAYHPLGITILGDAVQPAVPGAHIAMMSAEEANAFAGLKLRAAAFLAAAEEKTQTKTRRTRMASHLTRAQREKLRGQFPGRSLVGDQVDEDGRVTVCLLAGGRTEVCSLASPTATAHEEDIHEVPATVTFCLSDGGEIAVDADELLAQAAAEVSALEIRASAAETELASCKSEIERMKAQESARRIQAAREAALDTLRKFNANRQEKVPDDCLTELLGAVDAGEYVACTGKDGMWDGDKRVVREVKALCADAQMKQDAEDGERLRKQARTWGAELRELSAKGASAAGTFGEQAARQYGDQ